MAYNRRYRKRPARRPRRMARFRRARVARGPSKGFLHVVRRVKELVSSSQGTAGGYAITANNSVFLGSAVPSPAGTNIFDIPFSIVARLDELQAYTDFTSLFDQYKIKYMKVKVTPAFNTGTQAAIPIPYIEYVTDHDDAQVPSINAMREKMGVKTKYIGSSRPFVQLTVRPKVALKSVLTNASGTFGNVIAGSMWVNATFPETEHYAIKGVLRNMYIPASAAQSLISWDISIGVDLKDVQ